MKQISYNLRLMTLFSSNLRVRALTMLQYLSFYDLQERATTWKEGDCQYFKASDVWDDTDEFFRIGNCKNGSSLFYYGSNSNRPFNAGEVLTEVMKNGTKVTYFENAAPIREDPEL
jgi:hypothetical protein